MLRKLRKKIPKVESRYVPPPTLPTTSIPPIPWPEPTSTGSSVRRPPSPQFHATLNIFAESALPEGEPELPKQAQEPKQLPPNPPHP